MYQCIHSLYFSCGTSDIYISHVLHVGKVTCIYFPHVFHMKNLAIKICRSPPLQKSELSFRTTVRCIKAGQVTISSYGVYNWPGNEAIVSCGCMGSGACFTL